MGADIKIKGTDKKRKGADKKEKVQIIKKRCR